MRMIQRAKYFLHGFQFHYPNGHMRSIVLVIIQPLLSSFRNFMSSRTTVSARAYVEVCSTTGQSVAHIRRRGPKASYKRFTNSCASSHG